MRQVLAVAAAALLLVGPAGAATPVIEFSPEVQFTLAPKAPAALPSADVPNGGGSLRLPDAFTTPPARRASLGFPALHGLWQRAGAAYGIPWQVLASINRIESNFGQNMGPSSAGAVGWMQFMPSTWLRWGMDADGDGVADPWNPEDAIFSAARYLAAAGGATDLPRAIFAYNHAQWYVDEVLAGARLYGGGGDAAVGFTAAPTAELETAKAAIADLEAQLGDARRSERRLAGRAEQLATRAGQVDLLSHRLSAERDAAQAGFLRDDAVDEVERLEADLADAQDALEQARQEALASAVAPGLAGLTPSFAGDYVFPVGGGPGAISVAHDHHDYPAADIAAPHGAPLFALTDGYVVDAWPEGNGNCGIGFTLQAGDGREWTYCHMSYLEPTVAPGTALGAGESVGLVGSTGHSTGPHLHLQLQPAIAYPQDEPWFQALAGTAFSWQDSPRDGAERVFAVVGEPAAIEFSRADS
jgi:murein DD-endopeptidase MepM/ murein hydrolase activator NlpD